MHALVADSGKTEDATGRRARKPLGTALPFEAPWYADNELDRHRAMLAAFLAWRAATRHELTEVGTEVDVDGVLAEPAGGSPGVRVRGRVDRLERDAEGRLVVVDVKTGKTPVTKDDAQRHAQLGAVSAGRSPKVCSPTATSPAAAGWSTSARPAPAAPPNASRPR